MTGASLCRGYRSTGAALKLTYISVMALFYVKNDPCYKNNKKRSLSRLSALEVEPGLA